MKPSYIQLYPTLRCTQSCEFCFNHGIASHADMSLDEAMRLLEIAQGIASIDIMGGEPFLLQWMPRFIEAALGRGIAVNVSTNGSLPDAILGLRGLSGLPLQVGVSLLGASASAHATLTGSDNFELAIESIRTIKSIGLEPVAKTVVSRRNSGELDGIARLLKGLGVPRYNLIHMDALGENALAYSFPEFIDIHQKTSCEGIEIGKVHASCFDRAGLGGIRCAGGTRKLMVMPDGSVYPCNLLVNIDGFRLGNIFDDPYDALISSEEIAPLKVFASNRCDRMDCGNHQNCTGGCPAHLYSRGLPLDAGDPRCMR